MDAKELPDRPNLEQYRTQAEDLLEARNSADAQHVIAREHGFDSWPEFAEHIEGLNNKQSTVSRFEAAAAAVITGDIATLESLLRESPDLIRERSTRSHHATLLHYVAANGVEDFRQMSPKNAVAVANLLLNAGAEPDAPADAYGSKWATTMDLLVSSCHPANAGVQVALVDTLVDFGAAVNGVHDNSSPLITALAFHYSAAAEALARRGARVDTVVAAAGLGREDLVNDLVDPGGTLKPGARLIDVPWMRIAKDPKANLDLAFVWAAMHHRTGVVDLLLRKGVDPGATDQRRWTALRWAAFSGYMDTVQLLLAWKPPLEAKNEYEGTVLGQTLWSTVHEGRAAELLPIIEKLVEAGAKVNPDWLRPDLHPPLDPRVAEALR
jgi:hypothetical protein